MKASLLIPFCDSRVDRTASCCCGGGSGGANFLLFLQDMCWSNDKLSLWKFCETKCNNYSKRWVITGDNRRTLMNYWFRTLLKYALSWRPSVTMWITRKPHLFSFLWKLDIWQCLKYFGKTSSMNFCLRRMAKLFPSADQATEPLHSGSERTCINYVTGEEARKRLLDLFYGQHQIAGWVNGETRNLPALERWR